MQNITQPTFSNVKIKDGFWKQRQDLNSNVTLGAIYSRFKETGRFDAFDFNYKQTGIVPHIYYDSDVAKWIESASYMILNNNGGFEKEQEIIDGVVDSIEKHQLDDGYFNTHYIQVEPENRFTERSNHELYCAGHLIEGAIAYHKATGKRKFLSLMEKYVDCIEKAFITEQTAKFITPGHPEIELALIKLYEHTNNQKYLNLANHFLDNRGVNDEPHHSYKVGYNKKQIQSEVPVRELSLAEGHAVCAGYLYTGMAESAKLTKDKQMLDACKRIWRDIVDKKMYVTGGVGSSKAGEAFTVGFDLPNLEAYSESCASIALMFFANAMQKSERNAEYGAVIERVMYNGLLSSTSLDGKSFFYENPLEYHLASVDRVTNLTPENRGQLPIRHRKEVFSTSCCPPNISRTIARLGDFFFSTYENEFVVNQYAHLSYDDGKTAIEFATDYPNDGKVLVKLNKCDKKQVLFRIPEWCEKFSVSTEHKVENGYIVVSADKKQFEIDFKIEPYYVEADPRVRHDNGRVALCYGPIVYCIERVDNDFELNALSVDIDKPIKVLPISTEYNMHPIEVSGFVDNQFGKLYRKLVKDQTPITLSFRPYYSFANREECDMLVWVRKK